MQFPPTLLLALTAVLVPTALAAAADWSATQYYNENCSDDSQAGDALTSPSGNLVIDIEGGVQAVKLARPSDGDMWLAYTGHKDGSDVCQGIEVGLWPDNGCQSVAGDWAMVVCIQAAPKGSS
ncbi:Uu.00g090670.m01.CDS01 [Anthostomella pinea]|uniref:Uu.00g090670.m01.CDS01 n=1 Tax=Anthostomella pinea TaxID=933095 RepID=A0AAI8VMW4_9PEZI|nr:Uu.00g090670.m01.CDS01 [Anthostomella pinea]